MKMSKNKIFVSILLITLIATLTSAADFTPVGPQNMRNTLPIFNLPQLNLTSAASQICFGTLCMNGTNISAGGGGGIYTSGNGYINIAGSVIRFNETVNNATIENRISPWITNLNNTIINNNQSLLSEINARLSAQSALYNNVTSVNSSLTTQTSRIDSVNSTNTIQTARIDSLNSTFTSGISSINSSLNTQTNRIDNVNSTVIANNQSLNTEVSLRANADAATYNNLTSINATLTNQIARIDSVNSTNTVQTARIDSLNTTISSNNQSLISEINARIAADLNINGTKLNSSNPTFTGTLNGSSITITGTAESNQIITDSGTSSSGNTHITFENMSDGTSRFKLGLRDDEIGGNNNGSDFYIWRYNDSGSWIGNALVIARDTGLVSFGAVAVPWNNITGFPSACPSGWVSTISGTITCTALTSLNALATISGYNIEINSTLVNRTITSNTGWVNNTNLVQTPHSVNITGNLSIGSGTPTAEIEYNTTSAQIEIRPIGVGARITTSLNVSNNICVEGTGACWNNLTYILANGTGGDVQAGFLITDTTNYTGYRRNSQIGMSFPAGSASGGSTQEELNITPKLTFDIDNSHTILVWANIGRNASNSLYGIVGENSKWNIWMNGNQLEHSYRNSTSGTRGNADVAQLGWQCIVGTLSGQTAELYRANSTNPTATLIDSDSISALGSLNPVTTQTKIGGNTIGSGTFNASLRDLNISKVVIWNTTLTASEIAGECLIDKNQPANQSRSIILQYLLNRTEDAFTDSNYVYDTAYVTSKEYHHLLKDSNNIVIQPSFGNTIINGTLRIATNRNYGACTTTNAGDIVYNYTSNKHLGCNSTAWNNLY